ncbi:glycoside hydrolase family 5 protein [Polyangium mundeleinium]|uniref:Glycoside hydrolase family 5 protein n=1 Tax=Polyangium mundeleinium TaxID=2995306 RepID=A0ABT5ES06_9BACT|nr:glycoside hydrolase family 5 protein [Polyangium mundeleinium]MDC0744157.1 glycoside hydrolase family 5 protein [Polyangium mundeleinium]
MRALWQTLLWIPLVSGCIPRGSARDITPNPAGVAQSAPFEGFRRGINLGNALDAPNEGAWGVTLDERHFEMAAAAGLDHVRLPVRFNAHAQASAPFTVDAAFLERVDWALDRAAARGLSVILDFHHYEELMKEPAAHTPRFLGIWTQLAERYARRPPSVVFELLNEPNGNLNADIVNEISNKAIAIIRAKNPTRRIIVDGYFWASADWLDELTLPKDDPNLIPTFHMYQPILFTHQGAPWMAPEYGTTGIVFPGPPAAPLTPALAAQRVGWVNDWFSRYNTQPLSQNPNGPAGVRAEFEKVDRYIQASGRRVYMGEFGCIDNADQQSRATYVRLIRREAELRGIAWAYWDDGGTMKAMDVKTGSWVTYLQDALLR